MKLLNLTVQNSSGRNIRVVGAFSTVLVQDCVVSGSSITGAYIAGSTDGVMTDLSVIRCTFFNNGTDGNNNHDGLFVGDGATGVIVEFCRAAYNNSDLGAGFDFSSSSNGDLTGTIRSCESFYNDRSGIAVSGMS